MEKIWCIEDEKSIRDILLYTLRSCRFEARGFESAVEFLKALEDEKPDLILLDIMLPCTDGICLLKMLRNESETAEIPVIMTTARSLESDKVEALEIGADDYLVKPFGMMEMIARIRAVLRRSRPGNSQPVLESGAIRLDPEGHRTWLHGEPIELTPKEFALLRLFLQTPDHLFLRDELFSLIWKENCMLESRTIDVHIASLRSKLKEEGRRIETVRGLGYRLVLPQ